MRQESMVKKAAVMSNRDLKADLMKLNRKEERTDLEEQYRKLVEKEYLQRVRGEKKDPHLVIYRDPVFDAVENFDPWVNTPFRGR
jgi:glucose-6-phosphate isomerase